MKKILWTLFPAIVMAQMFSFQQSDSFAVPGSIPAPGEVWQSQWVSGNPYSATVVTHTVQTLSGEKPLRVEHTETGLVFRDAQGRTRRETIGPVGGTLRANQISIVDPVAGVEYDLRPPLPGPARGGGVAVGHYSTQKLSPNILENETKPAGLSPYQLAMQQYQGRKQKQPSGGGGRGRQERTVDDLGTLTINGVVAQGVRITTTIPVGGIGNDTAIPVITERWVSPELQVLVKSVYSDPRFGTTTYELTDIQRTPPDPSLFQLPAGYEERPSGKRGGGGEGIQGFKFEPKKSSLPKQ